MVKSGFQPPRYFSPDQRARWMLDEFWWSFYNFRKILLLPGGNSVTSTQFSTSVLGGTAALHVHRAWGAVFFWPLFPGGPFHGANWSKAETNRSPVLKMKIWAGLDSNQRRRKASRFTVCPVWPLRYLPVDASPLAHAGVYCRSLSEEFNHRVHHKSLRLTLNLRINRQRHCLARGPLRLRKIA